jgi:hypothetical protein
MKNLSKVFIFLHIFCSALVLFKTPVEFYPGYISYFLLPYLLVRYGVTITPLVIFFFFYVVGLFFVSSELNTLQQLNKVTLGFFLSMSFFEYVMRVFDFDVKEVFKFYMKCAFFVSAIGLMQYITYQIGFAPGYNFRWLFNKWGVIVGDGGIRVNSLFSEPAYYASSIAPAFFVSVYNILNRNSSVFITVLQSVIIILAYPLTRSSVGIFGILLTLVLLVINSGFLRYGLIAAPVLFFGFNFAYANIVDFRDRVDGTFEIYNTGNIYSYNIHGSSFVLYNHTHIAQENFYEHPIFGTGLGSHETAFNKYSLTNMQGVVDIEFNKADANSMALRLMSETGLVGLIIFGLFFVFNWLHKPFAVNDEYWIINNACFLIISLQLLRQGNYYYCGFPLFIWLYYYSKKRNREESIPEAKEFKFKPNV